MICLTSALARCFQDTPISPLLPLTEASILKNENFSFQLAYGGKPGTATLRIDSPIANKISVQKVCYVECVNPLHGAYPKEDEPHLHRCCDRINPGFYPSRLEPLTEKTVEISPLTHALWFDIEPDGLQAGVYPVIVTLGSACASFTLKILNAELPDDNFMYTQWFHADCLASYYRCPVWSEQHWQIVENFMRTARQNGIDTILTPVFTPPLDTAVGHERPTTQLIDVTKNGDNYTFGFDRLDKWVDLCLKIGFRNFEISHLYTQWGAIHAPKIVATVNGKEERIFGWETDAQGPEYVAFLRAFLTAFLNHMKAQGLDKRCLFHISDEPRKEHLKTYRQNYKNIADILNGYIVMDALSNYSFYEEGIVTRPIPTIEHSEDFLKNNVPGLCVYYCVRPLLSITWANTRGLARGFFKHDIAGFLHWGYNFYYNQFSLNQHLDPYEDNHAGETMWLPCGDPFSVYPAPDGTAYDTVYLRTFAHMLQDLRAYKLCAKKHGKDFVLQLMDEICGPTPFGDAWVDEDKLLTLREKINDTITK